MLAIDTRRLEKEIEEAQAFVPEFVRLAATKMLLQGVNGVTEKMRVDTGRARGGTLLSIGSEKFREDDNFDRGGNLVRAQAQAAVSALKPFEDGFVTNAVSYVYYLEKGTEHIPPGLMFERTAAEIASQFGGLSV